MEKLHNKLKHRNRILTVAVSAAKEIMADAYDFTQICKFADFVNVMGYDLHLSNATSSHAPLRRELDELPTRDFLVIFYKQLNYNVEFSVVIYFNNILIFNLKGINHTLS